jgi:hypothetical protein
MTGSDPGAWRGAALAEWRADVAKVAAELVAPLAAGMDEADTLPPELIPGLARAGLFAPLFPDGPGTAPDMRRFVVAVEELAKVSGAAALALAIQALGAFPLEVAGSPAQKARWYPELTAGRGPGRVRPHRAGRRVRHHRDRDPGRARRGRLADHRHQALHLRGAAGPAPGHLRPDRRAAEGRHRVPGRHVQARGAGR